MSDISLKYLHIFSRRAILALIISVLLLLTACSKGEPETSLSDLPSGNAENGAVLFNQKIDDAPACSSCHNIDDTKSQGPGLGGFSDRAADAVDGQSAKEYAYYSILRPSKHLVSSFSNLMYSDYEEKLSAQQLADLIVYILSL